MAQTLTRLLIHVVFSTRNREPLIDEGVESRLFAYIGGICRDNDCVLEAAGGASDHIHLLVSASKNLALAELLRQIKRSTSVWFKQDPLSDSQFSWQDGYGAFSIGASQVEALREYFGRQREHHQQVTFQDEFRTLLEKYGVAYDEERVWG